MPFGTPHGAGHGGHCMRLELRRRWSEKQTFEKFNPQLVSGVMTDVTLQQRVSQHEDSKLPRSSGTLGGRLEGLRRREREIRKCQGIYKEYVSCRLELTGRGELFE